MNAHARLFLLLGGIVIAMCVLSKTYLKSKIMETRMSVLRSINSKEISSLTERRTGMIPNRGLEEKRKMSITTMTKIQGSKKDKVHHKKSKIKGSTVDFSKFKPEIQQRFISVQRKCKQMKKRIKIPKQIPINTLKRILVNDKYKFMICVIPKVSSTSWRRMMLLLSGKFPKEYILHLPGRAIHNKMLPEYTTLKQFNKKGREFRLRNYTKVMFTRNPFERILSAYRSKFVNGKEFHKLYGTKIIKKFRPHATKAAKKKGHNATFLEFIKFFVWQKEWFANNHWAPYWNLCDPCRVKYDYIGLFNNLIAESNEVLRYIGAEDFAFPPREKYYKESKTDEVLKTYYSQIPEAYIPDIMQKLKKDLELYSFLNWTIPETG